MVEGRVLKERRRSSLPAISNDERTPIYKSTKLSDRLGQFDNSAEHFARRQIVDNNIGDDSSANKLYEVLEPTQGIQDPNDISMSIETPRRLHLRRVVGSDDDACRDWSTLRSSKSLDVNDLCRAAKAVADKSSRLPLRLSLSSNIDDTREGFVNTSDTLINLKTGLMVDRPESMSISGDHVRFERKQIDTWKPTKSTSITSRPKLKNEELKLNVPQKLVGLSQGRSGVFVQQRCRNCVCLLTANLVSHTHVRKTDTGLEIIGGRSKLKRTVNKHVESYSQIRVQHWVDSQRSLLRRSLPPEAVR